MTPESTLDPAAPVIEATGLGKTVMSGDRPLTILKGLELTARPGEIVCVRGPSGSGKSTLLGLLAGLDAPTSGAVRVAGTDLGSLDEERLARFRAKHLGFVFQSFHLLPNLTALENVGVPLEIAGVRDAHDRARELLESFGLGERSHHLPSQISGGEQQRVAIARAIANEPMVILADEPTGNLDEDTGARIADLLVGVRDRTGATLLIATHDSGLAARADRRLLLRGGALHEEDAAVAAPEAEEPALVAV